MFETVLFVSIESRPFSLSPLRHTLHTSFLPPSLGVSLPSLSFSTVVQVQLSRISISQLFSIRLTRCDRKLFFFLSRHMLLPASVITADPLRVHRTTLFTSITCLATLVISTSFPTTFTEVWTSNPARVLARDVVANATLDDSIFERIDESLQAVDDEIEALRAWSRKHKYRNHHHSSFIPASDDSGSTIECATATTTMTVTSASAVPTDASSVADPAVSVYLAAAVPSTTAVPEFDVITTPLPSIEIPTQSPSASVTVQSTMSVTSQATVAATPTSTSIVDGLLGLSRSAIIKNGIHVGFLPDDGE